MATLGFEVEWFDTISKLVQKLFLKVYLEDNTVEILREQKKPPFLNRIFFPDLTFSDLFIGNSVTIFNRILTIKAYANSTTIEYMKSREVHYLCALHAEAINKCGDILNLCKEFNLEIGRVKTCTYGIIGSFSVSDGDILLELVGFTKSNIQTVLSTAEAITSKLAIDVMEAESIEDVIGTGRNFRISTPCTVCVIKPHVFKDKHVGDIVKHIIDSGFQLKGLVSLYFNTEMVEEFFGVYRGAFPSYNAMATHLVSGPCLALLITGNSPDLVNEFRELCGPVEPEVASTLRPNTIRALYGRDLIKNAVHCTDLAEDSEMEAKFLFEILGNF
mmetsp:Transcript_26371/g.26617  ORF Transcript_26371/g.26617 Transcript_26371/m.26617 type:complete len:331 (+) Transcript_26371:110-1102(+)